ncbi:hypothetical protein DPEC_G00267330 [Dallia pectoralis]|uniref:Uncharacterized protein n=1 Tax=Dallia pectoralis TaxID=75939 RepID=A0ACC2FNF8_DALPE|nr:hypothetical protein DPEC_G00267330 [Dallia pectoralis]
MILNKRTMSKRHCQPPHPQESYSRCSTAVQLLLIMSTTCCCYYYYSISMYISACRSSPWVCGGENSSRTQIRYTHVTSHAGSAVSADLSATTGVNLPSRWRRAARVPWNASMHRLLME